MRGGGGRARDRLCLPSHHPGLPEGWELSKGSGAFRSWRRRGRFFDDRRSTCHDVKESLPAPALPLGCFTSSRHVLPPAERTLVTAHCSHLLPYFTERPREQGWAALCLMHLCCLGHSRRSEHICWIKEKNIRFAYTYTVSWPQDRASYMVVDTEFFPPPEAGVGDSLLISFIYFFSISPIIRESLRLSFLVAI